MQAGAGDPSIILAGGDAARVAPRNAAGGRHPAPWWAALDAVPTDDVVPWLGRNAASGILLPPFGAPACDQRGCVLIVPTGHLLGGESISPGLARALRTVSVWRPAHPGGTGLRLAPATRLIDLLCDPAPELVARTLEASAGEPRGTSAAIARLCQELWGGGVFGEVRDLPTPRGSVLGGPAFGSSAPPARHPEPPGVRASPTATARRHRRARASSRAAPIGTSSPASPSTTWSLPTVRQLTEIRAARHTAARQVPDP